MQTVENDLVAARQEDRTLGPEIFHRQVITYGPKDLIVYDSPNMGSLAYNVTFLSRLGLAPFPL